MKEDAKPAVRNRTQSGVHVAITLGAATEHNLWSDLDMDISGGGVFVATYVALGIGMPVELLITLEGEEHPIAASGVVRWTRAHQEGDGAPAGVGVRFVELPSDAAASLAHFAQHVRQPELFELDEIPMRARSSDRMRVG